MGKYHMRRQDREIVDEEKIKDVIRKGKYAIVAMSDDNMPYLVTLSCGYDESKNAIYFHAAKEGYKMDIIKNNSNVCATIIDDGGYVESKCAHKYCSVVIRGQLQRVVSQDEKRHGTETLIRHLEKDPEVLLDKLKDKKANYERMAILRLDIEHTSCKEGQ